MNWIPQLLTIVRRPYVLYIVCGWRRDVMPPPINYSKLKADTIRSFQWRNYINFTPLTDYAFWSKTKNYCTVALLLHESKSRASVSIEIPSTRNPQNECVAFLFSAIFGEQNWAETLKCCLLDRGACRKFWKEPRRGSNTRGITRSRV